MNTFIKGDKVITKSGKVEMTVVRLIGDEKEDEFVFINSRGYEKGDVICELLDVDGKKKFEVIKRKYIELL